MARYEVTCDEPRPRLYGGEAAKDATAITLQVTRDSEHFAWVRAVASNPSLRGLDASSNMEQFWSHFAQAAVPLIEDAIKHGEILGSEVGDPPYVLPAVQTVVAAARRGPALPPLTEGGYVGEFTI